MYLPLRETLFLAVQLRLLLTQSCLRPGTSGQKDINIEDDDIGNPHLPNSTQAIITSYQFGCCGDITGWEAVLEPNGPSHMEGGHTIHFQVWRPSPTVESDGCYSLVGENRFTSITFSNDILSATPEATNYISVRPEDVIGFYSITNRDQRDEGMLLYSYLNGETVWYHTGTDSESLTAAGAQSCPYPVGSARTLASSTNLGPAVSVSITTSECTPLPTPTATTDSPPATTDSPTDPTSVTTDSPPSTREADLVVQSSQTPSLLLSTSTIPTITSMPTITSTSTTPEQPNLIIAGSIMAACMLAVLLTAGFLLAISITIQRKKNSSANNTMVVNETGNCFTDVRNIVVNPAYGCGDRTSPSTDIPKPLHVYSSVSSPTDDHSYTNITEHQLCSLDHSYTNITEHQLCSLDYVL